MSTSTPAIAAPMEAPATAEPAVSARGLGLDGSRGAVYSAVDLDIAAGAAVALVGAQGSGRTALLLTLSGRMAFTSGTLRLLGHDLPRGRRDVQHHAAVAHVAGIDDLDEGLTIGELFEERSGLSVPLWRRPLRRTDPGAGELAALAYGAGSEPDWATPVWALSPLQRLQTCLLLALIGSPRVVVVDDVDSVRDPDEQRLAWASLRRAAERGIAVAGSTTAAVAVPAGVRVVPLIPRPASAEEQ